MHNREQHPQTAWLPTFIAFSLAALLMPIMMLSHSSVHALLLRWQTSGLYAFSYVPNVPCKAQEVDPCENSSGLYAMFPAWR